MRNKEVNRKTIIFVFLFLVLSICVAALYLTLGDNIHVFASFTKQEMLDDYEYFWEELEKNWPYFHTAKENNIDLAKIKEKYKEKISSKSSAIFNTMSDMAEEISSYNVLGKIYVVDSYSQCFMSMEERYSSNKAIIETLNDEDTIQKYKYINKQLMAKVIDKYSLSMIVGANSEEEAKVSFDKNIQVEIIEKDKIAKIKINSMFISSDNSIMTQVYEENFKEIYKNLSNYEHIIFDVSDCVGTSSYLWKNFIIAPNINVDKKYAIVCIYNNTKNNEKFYSKEAKPATRLVGFEDLDYLNNFNSFFKQTINIKSNLYEYNISNAEKWIITNKNTKLEANNFVNFAKETNFATVVGADIGRLDVPVGVGMIKLPNLGLVIAYDGLQYLNATGIKKLGEIKADIKVSENENVLDLCLNKIKDYELSKAFKTYIKKVNEERKEKVQSELDNFDTTHFTPDYPDEVNVFSQEEIDNFLKERDSGAVTKVEAIEDIETLFKLYKYTYAGYDYFGGDSTYNEAKKNIIKDIENFSKEEISGKELLQIIKPYMDFIQDGHHSIFATNQGKYSDAIKLCNPYRMYNNEEYDINFKDGKYYISVNNKELLIESFADDTNLEKYIKTTISDSGKLCHGLVSLFTSEVNANEYSQIKVVDGDRKTTINITWNFCKNMPVNYDKVFEKNIVNGIPVYSIHTLSAKNSDDLMLLDKFSESAIESKKNKIFIIDFRGNGGGNDSYARNWFYYYTDSYPITPIQALTKSTPLYLSYIEKELSIYGITPTENQKYSSANGKWDRYISNESKWFDNENTIIVLMDYNSASSSEIMIRFLKYLDNVVFIGCNSRGAQLIGNVCNKYLPNSGLAAYYGHTLFFNDNTENIDGKGYMPDIWVSPSEALDRVIKLCEYYKLK